MSQTIEDLRTRLLAVDQWSPQAAALREQILETTSAGLQAEAETEATRYERVGSWRIEKPAPAPVPEPVPEVVLGDLPASVGPHRDVIARAQSPRAQQLVALLSGIQPHETLDVSHYSEDPLSQARLAERRAQIATAAGGRETVAKFWKVVDAEGVRPLAESVRADTLPEVVQMVAGWEPV